VGYFDGTFEFKLDIRYTSCVASGFVHVWGLFNAVGDRDDACGSPKNYVGVYFGGEGLNNAKIVLLGFYNDITDFDQWLAPVANTTYYLTVKRMEKVVTCIIYSSSSDREAETNSLANLSIMLGELTTFQFLYAGQSMTYGVVDFPISGYLEKLELVVEEEVGYVWDFVTALALTSPFLIFGVIGLVMFARRKEVD